MFVISTIKTEKHLPRNISVVSEMTDLFMTFLMTTEILLLLRADEFVIAVYL